MKSQDHTDLDRFIDGRLTLLFPVPAASELRRLLPPPLAPPRRLLRAVLVRSILAAAAAVLLIFLVSQSGSDTAGPATPAGPTTNLAELYSRVTVRTKAPPAACTNEADLATHLRDQQGQPLHLAIRSDRGVSGPVTCEELPATTVLTGWSPTGPVLLLVDRRADAPVHTLPTGSGLTLHRREIGELVIHEVSADANPSCLDLFFQPAKND